MMQVKSRESILSATCRTAVSTCQNGMRIAQNSQLILDELSLSFKTLSCLIHDHHNNRIDRDSTGSLLTTVNTPHGCFTLGNLEKVAPSLFLPELGVSA